MIHSGLSRLCSGTLIISEICRVLILDDVFDCRMVGVNITVVGIGMYIESLLLFANLIPIIPLVGI
jgi:hypothetical protein